MTEQFHPGKSITNRIVAKAAGALTSLPDSALRVFGKRTNKAGYALDADVFASLQVLKALPGEDFVHVPVREGRKLIDTEAYLAAGKVIAVGDVRDIEIAGVKTRIYRPKQAAATQKLPTIVYLHGGGWVLGSLNSHDNTCRFLARETNAQVIAVDYALAPEAPYPAGLNDVLAVYKFLQENGAQVLADSNKIILAGDSAGGNLTAAACLRLRAEKIAQPLAQVLFVPVTDLYNMNTASYAEFSEGYFLTAEQMRWYRDHYCGSAQAAANPEISPLLAVEHTDLAPAYISVAGFDPLRDEGIAYAEKLKAAGVPTKLRINWSQVHPFVNSVGIWRGARHALRDASRYISAQFVKADAAQKEAQQLAAEHVRAAAAKAKKTGKAPESAAKKQK